MQGRHGSSRQRAADGHRFAGEADGARPPSVDEAVLRGVLGSFPTGVTVVATVDEGGVPVGVTVSAFASVSLVPPLVLVSLRRSSRTLAALTASGCFAVNILSASQEPVAVTFASQAVDRFEGVAWTTALTGAPILAETSGWLDCRTHKTVAGGDHTIVIGRVLQAHPRAAAPLTHSRGTYGVHAPRRTTRRQGDPI